MVTVTVRGTGEPDALAVGEVRAIRTFRLGRDAGLYPVYSDRAWQPGDNTATCKRGRQHVAPAAECRCGFYAYGDATWTWEQPPAVSVLAVVACWGALEVATRGVRAQHARLEAVWLHRRVPDDLVTAVRARYPGVQVVRDRDALLRQHPLTVLEGYRPPRLVGRRRQAVTRVCVAVAALVALTGCLPASHLVTTAAGAMLWTAAVATVCGTFLAGVGMRSAAVATVGIVGVGWMLTTTGNGVAAIWPSRLPLLTAALLSAVLWLDLAAVGRPFPRRRQAAVRRVLARARRTLA